MIVWRTSFRREARNEDTVMQFHVHGKERFQSSTISKSAVGVAGRGVRRRKNKNKAESRNRRTQRARGKGARGGGIVLLPPRLGGVRARSPAPKRAPCTPAQPAVVHISECTQYFLCGTPSNFHFQIRLTYTGLG